MSSKTKSVTAVLIVLALVAGVGMTKVGSKYKTQDKVNLIFANATSNSAKKAGEKFKELVEEYSDGDITVDLFPDNQLGDDKTVAEGVQNGDIDIGISSSGNLSTLYKDYYIYDTPYLFLNSQEVYDVGFDGKAAQEMLKGVSKVGLKHMAMWENGFRNCTNNDHAIETPADCKGQKIRTMENPIHLKAWKSIGANPTPMAFSELFTAMQQGTVDGEENPIGIIYSNRFYEVQKYISLTQHVYTPYVVFMNPDKYDSLTDEQQEIIDAMEATQCTPSLLQVIKIKKLSEAGKLTESEAEGILGEIKQKEADRVVFKNEQLYRFFPSTYTSEQMRREILEILKSWRNSNWI